MWARIFAILLLAASVHATAQPRHFQTTLTLQDPIANSTGVDTVIFYWSTFEVTGTVMETELYNLTMKLYVDGAIRYVDPVVVGGVVQLFDGQVREPGGNGYFWHFDLETTTLEQMVNAGGDLAMMSTGEHFVVNDSIDIPTDGIVDVSRFQDGVNQDGQSDFLDVQLTEQMLFFDGFESGDVALWSSATP